MYILDFLISDRTPWSNFWPEETAEWEQHIQSIVQIVGEFGSYQKLEGSKMTLKRH